jgi:hypothetical protein
MGNVKNQVRWNRKQLPENADTLPRQFEDFKTPPFVFRSLGMQPDSQSLFY